MRVDELTLEVATRLGWTSRHPGTLSWLRSTTRRGARSGRMRTVLHLDTGCYTPAMPTTRHRFSITETDELARTLDAAARVWPEHRNDRGELLRQVLHWGAERVEEVASERRAQRRAAIRATAGSLTGMYPPGAAQQLKEEWPE